MTPLFVWAQEQLCDLLGRSARRHPQAWEAGPKTRLLIENGCGASAEEWLSTLAQAFPCPEQPFQVRFVNNKLDRHQLLPEAQVYLTTHLSQRLLERAAQLNWIHLAVGGVEFLEPLTIPAHVKITTAAGLSAAGIAEHVIGLIIALDRRFDLAFERQQRGRWSQSGILEHILTLRGKTLGILGMGHNGQALIQPAGALGMRVIGFDQRSDLRLDGLEKLYGPDGLPDLLRESDFVVVCLPLSKETHRIIGSDTLALMRPSACLINVARGGLVDEGALAQALRRRQIAGAALDVLTVEPPPRVHPLRGCPKLLITPHVAGNIYTFRKEIQQQFIENLKAYLKREEREGAHHPHV